MSNYYCGNQQKITFQILIVEPVTSSAYGDWGLVPPKKPILQGLSPPQKANFGGDNKKNFSALRADWSPPKVYYKSPPMFVTT